MTRSDKIAFAVFAAALTAIVAVCWIVNGITVGAIDQGWATLIAAFVGLCAIAYQTRVGFQNLRASAIQQAQFDRSAREHHRQLDRQTLAGALAAELSLCASHVRSSAPMLAVQVEIYKHLGEEKITHPFEIGSHLPNFDPLVYKANVGQLGLLGPSTAHDVVSVYNMVLTKPTAAIKDVPAAMIAALLDGYSKAYENWLLDVSHVHKRLLAAYACNPDPGALYEDRITRTKKSPKD